MTTPSRTNHLCAVCHLRILTPWLVGKSGLPKHADLKGCIRALQGQLEEIATLVRQLFDYPQGVPIDIEQVLTMEVYKLQTKEGRRLSQMPSDGSGEAQGESLGEEVGR